jgi:serine protease Do
MINDGRCDVTRPRKPPRRWCTFLLGSAAAFAIALAAGTGGFDRPATTFAAPAHAASDQFRGPASFAPLVDRVRPAVVSVRVKLTEPEDATEQALPTPRNSPF